MTSLSPKLRYDLDAIVTALRSSAEIWVPQLFPNGRRVGSDWRLANIAGDPPRKHGSCVITLTGDRAGDWHDFDCDEGGGPLSTIGRVTGREGRDLFEYVAKLTGWAPGVAIHQVSASTAVVHPRRDAAREIRLVLEQACPLARSPAEAYLVGRGLKPIEGADLLFHPNLMHWETKSTYPALVGVVRDRDGVAVAIHRTYLQFDATRPDKVVKAPVAKPRMLLGKSGGGAVRLAPLAANVLVALSEGIETGLAVMTACRGLVVWATLSTSGLTKVQLPAHAKRILILADHDASGAGLRAAETTALRLRDESREVSIALPPEAGDDFNDLLLRDGGEAVRAMLRAVVPKFDDAARGGIGRYRPVNYAEPDTSLPLMRTDEGDLAEAVERAWRLLITSNRSPWLFRYAGVPTWVVPDDEGRPIAVTVTDERLRHMLAKLGVWRRMNRHGDLVAAHPSAALIKSVLATPDPGLPVLVGIANTPVFGSNGQLLTIPGYHPDARILYVSAPGFELPAIPQSPSAEQLTEARSLICDELLGDFPFVSPSEQAHAVALLLLGFLRPMIDGPTPLHLIDKPTPGTGATLMVDAIATVVTGAGASVMTEGGDEEEWRKRVTAKLRQMPSIILIDNLRRKFDSSSVAAALTAPFWEDRILGVSEMTRLPIRCAWIATGNNPEFSNEMARRLVRIRLDAHVERPWQRTDFRHPDLMTWVRANRGRLVAACLTICQAWIAAGRPRGKRSIGSYESWAQIMGGVLEVGGIEGFLCNLDEVMEASDNDGAVWRGFVSAWWNRFDTAEVGASDLYVSAISSEPPFPLGLGNERSQRIRLGKALASARDRVFRLQDVSVRVEICGTHQGARRWRLALAENHRDCP